MVVQEEGPTDGIAIVVSGDQSDIPDEFMDHIADMFRTVGEMIIMARCVKQEMYTTFSREKL